MRRFIYLLIFALSTLSLSAAEKLMFYKYEIDKGLSHNTVRCIMQDSDGFMWFGTADGLSRFDGRQYKIFPNEDIQTRENQLGNNSIYSLVQDDEGHIWVGTARGVYIYDPENEDFQRFSIRTNDGNNINGTVRQIVFDPPGRMWFGTSGQGLFIYDTKADTLFQTNRYGHTIGDIIRTGNGIIYAGTTNGRIIEFDADGHFLREFDPAAEDDKHNRTITALYNDKQTLYCGFGITELQAIDKKSGTAKAYRLDDTKYSASHFRKIFPLNEEELLIGTDNGLFVFSKSTGEFHPFDNHNLFGVSDQSVLDICRDSEGGIWIATEYGGVNYIPRNLRPFGHVSPISSTGLFGGRVVSSFAEDENQNIWVGTKDGGLIYYNPKRGSMYFHTPSRRTANRSISYHNIRSLLLDSTDLWIGTFSRGLDVMDTKTGTVRNYFRTNGEDNSIADNTVTALFKDRKGTIYAGTAAGLSVYRPETDDFAQISQLGNQASISAIMEDSRGNIWFATSNMGIYRLRPADGSWTYFYNDPANTATIPHNRVTALFEDEKGIIWIGTENGLCKFDYNSSGITRFEDNRTLPSPMISAITQDRNGLLWVSTSGGIFSLDPIKEAIEGRYTKTDGLQSNQFNPGAALAASDGKLYFGGINGFNFFDPDELESNDYIPRTAITDIRVNNLSVKAQERISATFSDADTSRHGKVIKFKPGSNNIAIDFAAFSYQSPQKNKYIYILEGWDDEWIYEDNATTAYYNNLPPGTYTFRVKGSNNDGIWSGQATAIRFEVSPPFYLSTAAYVIYILLILIVIGLVYYIVMRSQKRKLREYTKEQERLSYHAQIDFFTNIAHEIRTPLTLIKVPLEFIISSGEGSPQMKHYLDMMNTNTNNLLNLINQLLDFRKSGDGGDYELFIRRHDMKQLVTDICARFKPVVNIGNLTMEIDMPDYDIYFNIDADAFSKIANNLISNALKYASSKIVVSLRLKGTMLELSVADDGKGVDMAEREKIFDTFYQPEGSKTGSGIGLHLAKLLAEKHGGTIQVTNNRNRGAVFTVTLPLAEEEHTSLVSDSISDSIIPSSEAPALPDGNAQNAKDRILLIEDNDEVRKVTGEFLEMYYNVLYAANGKQGIDILDKENVDLIITDLMMPEMDGYELCEFVKSDIRYSHIPVIQLTAKTSLQDKIKGLEYGSDAYVEKPFSLEFLHTQVENLLENRRRLRNAYNAPPSARVEAGNTVYSKKDSEFIEKLNAEIEKYIETEDISLDHLAESMFMSRSNFYRKIKGLFGVSPNEYVKRYRLKRAAAIIAKNECRISDVYVKVGFNSASYFTKCFKKYFGVLPKDYAASVNTSSVDSPDKI